MHSGSGGSRTTAYTCRQCGSAVLDERSRQCCGEEMESIETAAVSEPELAPLLITVFDVSQTGIEICVHVMEGEETTAGEIATALDVHRSTVTRQLNRLQELGVVERRERSLKEGGQAHLFAPVPPEEARQRLREGLFSWVTDAATLLDEVDRRKLAAASEEVSDRSHSPSVRGDE